MRLSCMSGDRLSRRMNRLSTNRGNPGPPPLRKAKAHGWRGLTNVELSSANPDYKSVWVASNWTVVRTDPTPGCLVNRYDRGGPKCSRRNPEDSSAREACVCRSGSRGALETLGSFTTPSGPSKLTQLPAPGPETSGPPGQLPTVEWLALATLLGQP